MSADFCEHGNPLADDCAPCADAERERHDRVHPASGRLLGSVKMPLAAVGAPASTVLCRHIDAQGRCAECRREAVLVEASEAAPAAARTETGCWECSGTGSVIAPAAQLDPCTRCNGTGRLLTPKAPPQVACAVWVEDEQHGAVECGWGADNPSAGPCPAHGGK